MDKTCLKEKEMPYPRVCAHRGFHVVSPENSLPAYEEAIALGAQEIEFDLWQSSDGVIVSCHDADLERISTGKGLVIEHTYEELYSYDFGIKKDEAFKGLHIASFEDILRLFGKKAVMNIHIKSLDSFTPLDDAVLLKIIELIKKYGCEEYVYFMCGNPYVLDALQRLAPDIPRCAGADSRNGRPVYDIVDKALKYGCAKIQIFKPHFKFYPADYLEKTVKRAHENGIMVNIFYSDREDEAAQFIKAGCDTVLTNDYRRIANHLKKEGLL
ncbi:MAG: glycerophosphodiester phosphodiesterase [Clostridia bacterium]|nr:glycerophosphodiester phosphodiesterase [Clostridia bacterium]